MRILFKSLLKQIGNDLTEQINQRIKTSQTSSSFDNAGMYISKCHCDKFYVG